jgi:IclR family mhp operon transcriptional activator
MTAVRAETDIWPATDDVAPVRGAIRTLQVLRALNVRNGATVVELSRDTGISRGALYRLLETLREEGYVALDLSRHHYCLTMLVRSLAEGFSDEDWVVHVARPVLKRLQRAILWPTDLGTFMDNAMWIRETTRQSSTLTIDRGVAGSRFPMLRAATGRAYLAWCPDEEREQILRNLALAREPGFEIIKEPKRLDDLLAETRRRGYGLRFGEDPVETGAIAVPIKLGDRVLGCVNVTFIRRSTAPEAVAERCLSAMLQAASDIAAGAATLKKTDGRRVGRSRNSR